MKYLQLLLMMSVLSGAKLSGMADGALILEWNETVLEAVRHANPAPCLVSRNLAIIHGACFDVVNARESRFTAAFVSVPAPDGVDVELAVIAAASTAAQHLFPSQKALFAALEEEQLARFSDRPGLLVSQSMDFGRAIGLAAIERRADDNATTSVTYIPHDEPGKWRRTPPRYRPPEMPHWAKVRPFYLLDASQFRPPGPPALDSAEYTAALQEVRDLGFVASPWRTEEEQLIARFWSDFSYTLTPVGHWNEILRGIVSARGLDLLETARAFALLNLASADAGIAAWDCKYFYEFWRPVQAVHGAALDGNPETLENKIWESLLEAPPHPEYVSGHSTFSGAAATMLAHIFGSDDLEFTAVSASVPGVTRTYSSFSACAMEVGRSRIYGGIHYSFSNRDGLELGRNVAEWTFTHALRPVQ